MASFFRILSFGILLTLLSLCVSSQDLGSSNKLFGGTRTEGSSSKSARKSSVRVKSAVSRAKSSARSKTKGNIVSRKSDKTVHAPVEKSKTAKSKFTDFSASLPTKVEITVGRPKESPVPSGVAADKLFEELIDDGNVARDERNYPAAEAAYKRAQALKPQDSRSIYGLGNLYADQQRWAEAESAYRTALQLDPSGAVAHIALSYVLTQPIAAPNLSDRYEEAERLARRAIQLAPTNALAFDQLGMALELGGLIGVETENAYRKSIQLNPSFAPAYAHLGRLLRRRGLIKESAFAYQNAIDRAIDVPAKVLVADVMQSEQRFVESEQLLRAALESDPKNPSALLMLGRALATHGKFAEAEHYLKKNLEVSPNGFAACSQLSSLYVTQGKFELAENALLRAIRFVSAFDKRRLSEQLEVVGDGYMKTARRYDAERVYRQALALDSENESLAGKLATARRN